MDIFAGIGRLHPVILHLPIGILIFTFLLEVISRTKPNKDSYREAISLGLLTGMIFAIGSSISGLLLANSGGYQGDTLFLHKWVGLSMAGLSIIVYFLHSQQTKGQNVKYYFPSLCLLMILITVTGHLGGSITHGEGFLWKAPQSEVILENIDEAIAYEKVILPILNQKCNSCHNPSKAKGKLIMTTPQGLIKGGETGAVLEPGNITTSPIIQRVHLPLEDDDHMPPKSKKQLSEEEVQLLEWWIAQGASFEAQIQELEPTPEISAILSKYRTASATATNKIPSAKEGTLTALYSDGIKTLYMSEDSPMIEADLSNRQDISKSLLKKLNKIDEQLSSLDLGHSNVDNQMISGIRKLSQLRNLQLQKTQISDQAIRHLKGLDRLEVLNLYGTMVSDQILENLLALKSLKTIYLWQTNISEEFVATLQNERPLLKINYQHKSDLFGDATLKPPLITAEKDLFRDSLEVELQLNFKNVDIRYTLDGTEPDSLSERYKDPIVIDRTTLIKARSSKEGWDDSEVAQRQFVQSNNKIEKITLQSPPAERYKGNGPNTLADFRKGSAQFTDGQWLGYEGAHVTAILDMGKLVDIEGLTVSALEATGSWIFYPKGIKIWTSGNGSKYSLQKEASYTIADGSEPPASKNFTEEFETTQARYIKVKVESHMHNPDWHPAPGGDCWLFLDEIIVH